MVTEKQLIDNVKTALDNAYWYTETCHPEKHHPDYDKACNYLDQQRFSKKLIKNWMNEYADGIDEILLEARDNDKDDQWIIKRVTEWLAHGIAMERIHQFIWREGDRPGTKWHMGETVTFHIVYTLHGKEVL